MSQRGIVTCEASGVWASALARWFPDVKSLLLETRSVADCLSTIKKRDPLAVLVELSGDDIDRWELLASLSIIAPAVKAIAACAFVKTTSGDIDARRDAEIELMAREVGALAVVRSLCDLFLLAPIIEHTRARSSVRPRRLSEQLWARLPWSEFSIQSNPPALS